MRTLTHILELEIAEPTNMQCPMRSNNNLLKLQLFFKALTSLFVFCNCLRGAVFCFRILASLQLSQPQQLPLLLQLLLLLQRRRKRKKSRLILKRETWASVFLIKALSCYARVLSFASLLFL